MQVTGVPPTQLPFAWQVSRFVQILPSLQLRPVFGTGFGQPPGATQAPTELHWSAPMQVIGVPPAQLPFAWQVSPVVQMLPSSQPTNFTTAAGQPVAGTQAPTVWH